jgi:hypothetical protein
MDRSTPSDRHYLTCREPHRPDDRAAKQLVQLCLPEVRVCLHDDGSRPMMYDLDLGWPDGHAEAMEVTIAIDDDLLRLDHRLARHGSAISARESTRNWTLMLAPGSTEVRAIRREADHLLRLVERIGITSFGEHEARRSAAIARMRQLGVAYGFSFDPRNEQTKITLVGPAPKRAFVQPGSINEVVEDQARRNEQKLALSGCDERHLFVLFDFTSPEAWHAFIEQRKPPDPSPQLPEAITTAWVALPTGWTLPIGSNPIVWRVHRAGRWEVML